VKPSGGSKAGIPSSGNVRIPEWMVGADGDDEPRKRRLLSCAGVGVFLIAVLVTGAVVAVKQAGGEPQSGADRSNGQAATDPNEQPTVPRAEPLPNRRLPTFQGRHTRAVGRVQDKSAGVSYARLGKPWRVPSSASGLVERGFTTQRYVKTEEHGSQLWYGQLLTGTLSDAQRHLYGGRGTERPAATALAQQFEARFYTITHKRRDIASQELKVGGRRGWLVGFYVTYSKPGIKATGELVTVAVVDTGRQRPAVLFMAVPNTHKKLWPDVNYVIRSLKVLPGPAR